MQETVERHINQKLQEEHEKRLALQVRKGALVAELEKHQASASPIATHLVTVIQHREYVLSDLREEGADAHSTLNSPDLNRRFGAAHAQLVEATQNLQAVFDEQARLRAQVASVDKLMAASQECTTTLVTDWSTFTTTVRHARTLFAILLGCTHLLSKPQHHHILYATCLNLQSDTVVAVRPYTHQQVQDMYFRFIRVRETLTKLCTTYLSQC